jgi:hypothetical protein
VTSPWRLSLAESESTHGARCRVRISVGLGPPEPPAARGSLGGPRHCRFAPAEVSRRRPRQPQSKQFRVGAVALRGNVRNHARDDQQQKKPRALWDCAGLGARPCGRRDGRGFGFCRSARRNTVTAVTSQTKGCLALHRLGLGVIRRMSSARSISLRANACAAAVTTSRGAIFGPCLTSLGLACGVW